MQRWTCAVAYQQRSSRRDVVGVLRNNGEKWELEGFEKK
jgi:hypothetical protein